MYDLIIVGNGAAGLAGAIYAGRYRMNVLVVGAEFGGYNSIAGIIENYPGAPEIDGFELMMKMKGQAEKVGVHFMDDSVVSAKKLDDGCIEVTTQKGKTFHGHTLLLGQGTKRRTLGLPNEDALSQKGVHYCITCDGPLYRDKVIAVVGGGDASVKGINLAAQYASKIYFIIRGDRIKAEPINQEHLKKLGDKVEVLFGTTVTEIIGSDRLEKIKISKPYNGSDEIQAQGLFIEVGADPNNALATQLGCTLNQFGYVTVAEMMETSVSGVYAAGDIADMFGHFKQSITAAATGSVATTGAYEYFKRHSDGCKGHEE
ncbi:MAG: FAD-dependent oxidoreductase [bacterium]|nr:FAD-dependent oxidoreductase [bacterium]